MRDADVLGKLKTCARRLHIYRGARWVNRHFINRRALRAFQAELAFYSQFVAPGTLCFDVGANCGAKTEVFLRLGARVIAFEPQSDCLQELQLRLGRHPDLVPINAAVGSSSGKMTLFIERHRTASSLVQDWQGEVVGSIEVPVTTLDEAISLFGVPQFCKIDVEGYELEVLQGLSHAIPTISFEYHLGRDGVSRALACLDSLARFGNMLVNLAAAEEPVFAGSQWWGKDDFIEFFLREVPHRSGYDYGDIFVKFEESGSPANETITGQPDKVFAPGEGSCPGG